MTLIHAFQNRGITRDITIQDSAGSTITPGVQDKLRAIIKREDEEAVFTVTSDGPTSNGSSFTKGEASRLRLDASDLDFEPGVYSLVIDYYDNADAQEWKTVDKQVFVLEGI